MYAAISWALRRLLGVGRVLLLCALILNIAACSDGDNDVLDSESTTDPTTDPTGPAEPSTETPPSSSNDSTAPAIFLNSPVSQHLDQGETWIDPGATAIDDIDGAVPVVVDSSELNILVAGSYPVTYTAQDKAGNESSQVRLVHVSSAIKKLIINNLGNGQIDVIADGQTQICNDDCSYEFINGTVVELVGVDGGDLEIDEWEYCDKFSAERCTVTMNRDRTVVATFLSTRPVEYHSDVLFLNEAQMRAIRNYDPESDNVHFDNTVDFSSLLDGTVLAARELIIAEGDPGNVEIQFIRRVQNVRRNSDGSWDITTTNGSLYDVIASGTMVARSGSPPGPGPIAKDGALRASKKRKPLKTISLIDDTVLFDLDKKKNGFHGEGEIRLDGQLDADVYFKLYVAIEFGTDPLDEFQLMGGIHVHEPNNNLAFYTEGLVETTDKKNGKTVSLGKYPITGVSLHGFKFAMRFEPEVYLKLDINGQARLPMDVEAKLIGDVTYDDDRGWRSGSDSSAPVFALRFDQLEAELDAFSEIGLRAILKADASLISLLKGNASLTANPYVAGSYEFDHNDSVCRQRYHVDAGFRVYAKVNAGFAGIKLANERYSLMNILDEILADPCTRDRFAPESPAQVQASVLTTEFLGGEPPFVTIYWDAAEDYVPKDDPEATTGIAGYEIWRQHVDCGVSTQRCKYNKYEKLGVVNITNKDASGFEGYDDHAVKEGEAYNYRVSAFDKNRNHSGFTETELAAIIPPPDIEPPTWSGYLDIKPNNQSGLNLTWEIAKDNRRVAGYEVFRVLENGDVISALSEPVPQLGSFGTQYIKLFGLSPIEEYCYYVQAFDYSYNYSTPTATRCAIVDAEPPSMPSDLAIHNVGKSTSELQLTWSASTDNIEVARYEVHRTEPDAADSVIRLGVDTLSAVMDGLSDATRYCFTVEAVDTAGNRSPRPEPVCAYTFSSIPESYAFTAACQDNDPVIERVIDLDPNVSQEITLSGTGNDYVDDAEFDYQLSALHDAQAETLVGGIDWTRTENCDNAGINFCFSLGAKLFQNASERSDEFALNMESGDSGQVAAEQTKPAGCTAVIRMLIR